MMVPDKRRIVITGIGPLTSIGIGKEALWRSMLEGKTNVSLENHIIDGESIDSFYVHKIEGFNINDFGIEKNILNDIKNWKQGKDDVDLYFLMAAVKLALDDSGLSLKKKENEVGLTLTHENPGLETVVSNFFNEILDIKKQHDLSERVPNKKENFEKLYKIYNRSIFETHTFVLLFHVARAMGIHGYSLFTNNACSSGLYALEAASLMIKGGRNKAVIVAAGDYPRYFKHLWFKEAKMYADDGIIKPFDKKANGFVLGDGAVGFVLEDMEHAMARNAYIYAEYKGGGFHMEGWKITMPDVTGNSYQQTIKDALKQAEMSPEEIDLICAHGAGARLLDRYEAKAITNVFGFNEDKPLITAFKPNIGHNIGGSALLESAILLLAMRNNIVPPIGNSKNIDEKLSIYPAMELKHVELKRTLKICCALAGYNASVIFQKIED